MNDDVWRRRWAYDVESSSSSESMAGLWTEQRPWLWWTVAIRDPFVLKYSLGTVDRAEYIPFDRVSDR